MSKRARPFKVASIINLDDYKSTVKKTKVHTLRIDFWKDKKSGENYYTMKKFGSPKISHDFAAYGLACAIEDIMKYNNDPCDILELTEEMIARLDQEGDDDDDE